MLCDLELTIMLRNNKIYLKMIVLLITIIFSTTVCFAQSESPENELSIVLSNQAQQALNNGVLLTIDCEFANIESWWFFSRAMNKKTHQFSLSRHTLSNRYIVKRDNLTTPNMFRSIPEATNFIAAQSLSLLETYTTYDKQRKMRLSLNKFELPAPMRLQAFLLDKWDLDTGWLEWQFES